MTYWKTTAFKELQEAWYAKLAKEGFEDAEEPVGDEMELRQNAQCIFRHLDELSASNREEYFRQLAVNVQEHDFSTKVDRIIMLLRADGAKMKQIVETLNFLGKRRCRMTVRMTIRKYEMKWGIREYTPRQLNKKVPRIA